MTGAEEEEKKKKNEEKRKRLYSERNKYADEETGTRALCALPSLVCVTSSVALRHHLVGNTACVCPTCFAPLRRSRNDLMVVTVVLRKRAARPCQVVMCRATPVCLSGDASGRAVRALLLPAWSLTRILEVCVTCVPCVLAEASALTRCPSGSAAQTKADEDALSLLTTKMARANCAKRR